MVSPVLSGYQRERCGLRQKAADNIPICLVRNNLALRVSNVHLIAFGRREWHVARPLGLGEHRFLMESIALLWGFLHFWMTTSWKGRNMIVTVKPKKNPVRLGSTKRLFPHGIR